MGNTEIERLIAEFVKKWGFSNPEADAELEQDVRALLANGRTLPPESIKQDAGDQVPGRRRRAYHLDDE
jgi:hypothetical protein